MKTYKDVNEYIKGLPKDFVPKIKEIRALALKLIPKGKESIKYGMPTIELNDKNFIGIFQNSPLAWLMGMNGNIKLVQAELVLLQQTTPCFAASNT